MARRMVVACLIPVGAAAAAALSLQGASSSTAQAREARSPAQVGGAQLKLVQVVFRHGARTPLTDKYWDGHQWETGAVCGCAFEPVQLDLRNLDGGPRPFSKHDAEQAATKLPGGCSKGELTLEGQRQARDLGVWLRQRYVQELGFLPDQYQAGAVTGRTTNYQRTIATLQGVLTGLYPDADAPLPAATASDMDEVMFANVAGCERLKGLMQAQIAALRERQAEDVRVHRLDVEVRRLLRVPPEAHVSYTDLHDALTTLRFHGKQIPQGFTEDLLVDINREATTRMTAVVAPQAHLEGSRELLRLSMGRLFAAIVERMEAAAAAQGDVNAEAPAAAAGSSGRGRMLVAASSSEGSRAESALEADAMHAPDARMYLYSGHDTTIMPLLVTLGLDLRDWPEYVSNVAFELWERATSEPQRGLFWQRGGSHPARKEAFVRVLHNGRPLDLPNQQAGHLVPLDEFRAAYFEPFLISNAQRQQECAVAYDHDAPAPRPAAAKGGDSVQGL